LRHAMPRSTSSRSLPRTLLLSTPPIYLHDFSQYQQITHPIPLTYTHRHNGQSRYVSPLRVLQIGVWVTRGTRPSCPSEIEHVLYAATPLTRRRAQRQPLNWAREQLEDHAGGAGVPGLDAGVRRSLTNRRAATGDLDGQPAPPRPPDDESSLCRVAQY
jgi:hypothetical protein